MGQTCGHRVTPYKNEQIFRDELAANGVIIKGFVTDLALKYASRLLSLVWGHHWLGKLCLRLKLSKYFHPIRHLIKFCLIL